MRNAVRKSVLKNLVGALVLGTLLCVPAQAASQSAKPVVVVSVAGYDALLADLACLGEIGDHRDLDKSIDAIVKLFTRGRGLAGVGRVST